MIYETMSLDDRFQFKCPIFNADVEMRSCVLLRERVYRGRRHVTRRGCQACISGGKCPAAEIVRRIAFATPDATDACSSSEPVMGKLPADVLERILPVKLPDKLLRAFGVSDAEAELIASADERIAKQIGTAPRKKVEARGTRKSVARTAQPRSTAKEPAPSERANAEASAAARGDLAAAINT